MHRYTGGGTDIEGKSDVFERLLNQTYQHLDGEYISYEHKILSQKVKSITDEINIYRENIYEVFSKNKFSNVTHIESFLMTSAIIFPHFDDIFGDISNITPIIFNYGAIGFLEWQIQLLVLLAKKTGRNF